MIAVEIPYSKLVHEIEYNKNTLHYPVKHRQIHQCARQHVTIPAVPVTQSIICAFLIILRVSVNLKINSISFLS
jgi:mRNA degradation ribonuclease J1/J2